MSILLFIALMILLVTALDTPEPKRKDGPAGEPCTPSRHRKV